VNNILNVDEDVRSRSRDESSSSSVVPATWRSSRTLLADR
jgi:hypothetical protein